MLDSGNGDGVSDDIESQQALLRARCTDVPYRRIPTLLMLARRKAGACVRDTPGRRRRRRSVAGRRRRRWIGDGIDGLVPAVAERCRLPPTGAARYGAFLLSWKAVSLGGGPATKWTSDTGHSTLDSWTLSGRWRQGQLRPRPAGELTVSPRLVVSLCHLG